MSKHKHGKTQYTTVNNCTPGMITMLQCDWEDVLYKAFTLDFLAEIHSRGKEYLAKEVLSVLLDDAEPDEEEADS